MNLTKSLRFLEALGQNNNKEWMDANREMYKEAREEFIAFVDVLIRQLQDAGSGLAGIRGRDCVFRINRDIRFSKDKRPYKSNFGAAISEGGRHSENPSYYIHIQPGEIFVGGGIYQPPAETLKKIRQEVDYNAEELKKIVTQPAFEEVYGAIRGEKLKTAPKGYPKDHPNIEFLKLKSFVVMHQFSDDAVQKDGFDLKCLECFKIMKPFIDYLGVAVS